MRMTAMKLFLVAMAAMCVCIACESDVSLHYPSRKLLNGRRKLAQGLALSGGAPAEPEPEQPAAEETAAEETQAQEQVIEEAPVEIDGMIEVGNSEIDLENLSNEDLIGYLEDPDFISEVNATDDASENGTANASETSGEEASNVGQNRRLLLQSASQMATMEKDFESALVEEMGAPLNFTKKESYSTSFRSGFLEGYMEGFKDESAGNEYGYPKPDEIVEEEKTPVKDGEIDFEILVYPLSQGYRDGIVEGYQEGHQDSKDGKPNAFAG